MKLEIAMLSERIQPKKTRASSLLHTYEISRIGKSVERAGTWVLVGKGVEENGKWLIIPIGFFFFLIKML